jgi:hypothetical protein
VAEVSWNSEALAPLIAIDRMLSDRVRFVLVRMEVIATLVEPTLTDPKFRVEGSKVALGPELVPVPVRVTTCGLVESASVKVNVPEKVCTVVGLKVTFTVQLAWAARLVPQLLVCVKAVRLETMLVMEVAAEPLLVSVTAIGEPLVLICWLGNASNTVDRRNPGAGTVTCAVTMWVMLPLLATTVNG